MALFGFGKKKEETVPCCGGGEEIKAACACGGQCGISDIEKALRRQRGSLRKQGYWHEQRGWFSA